MIRLRLPALGLAVSGLLLILASCTDSRPITGAPQLGTVSDEPALLVCPTGNTISATRTLGLRGGLLSVGGTQIEIPAGAVSVPTEFTITIPASRYMEVDISATGVEHFVFQKPARITIGYARCQNPALATAPLEAWHIDVPSKRLLERMGGLDDKRAKAVTFETGHLSGYSIATRSRQHDH